MNDAETKCTEKRCLALANHVPACFHKGRLQRSLQRAVASAGRAELSVRRMADAFRLAGSSVTSFSDAVEAMA